MIEKYFFANFGQQGSIIVTPSKNDLAQKKIVFPYHKPIPTTLHILYFIQTMNYASPGARKGLDGTPHIEENCVFVFKKHLTLRIFPTILNPGAILWVVLRTDFRGVTFYPTQEVKEVNSIEPMCNTSSQVKKRGVQKKFSHSHKEFCYLYKASQINHTLLSSLFSCYRLFVSTVSKTIGTRNKILDLIHTSSFRLI